MSVSNSMGTKKVEELLANKSMPQGMQFFVPNYQRGYRWKESQVQQLLNDLSEFDYEKGNESRFYCLQPLVVKEDKEKGWIVIDGQQRLTTLFIILGRLRKHLSEKYHCEMDEHCMENVINMMTNEFPTSAAKKTYAQCVFLKKEQDDYGISDVYGKMLQNPEFCAILEELVDFGISRYKVNYSYHYQDTNLVLYQKYTYEDACRLLNWERNEVPLNIGGYKYDKKTKTFPIFINYDKQDNISDTTKYEDHFVAENRLIAISKSGRSMDSEDVQNFLNATERGIDVQLFVRKNKDDKISKEFYYLGRVIATGNAKQFVMPNTDKTAVEIEWELETPVREDIYQYIVNE